MILQRRTIQKLLREGFRGAKPLVVAAEQRKTLEADLKARLARMEGVDVDTKDYSYIREEEKPRLVASFTIVDSEPNYYYRARGSFRMLFDEQGRLTIKAAHDGDWALVSDLDEVVAFVRTCKQRMGRHKALRAKRDKVRELLSQAILAQVRKLAKEERFDFMSQTDSQKLNLFVKLSDEHAVVLRIPFKQFKEIVPQLRSMIANLRQIYQCGVRVQIVGRRSLPWRMSWVTHESL